jgi:hypothetical protein
MFKQLFFLILLMILSSGCSSNKALVHFNKDELFSKALQFSKKCDLTHNDEVQVMLSATYLDPVYAFNEKSKKHFLVGIYDAKQSDSEASIAKLLSNKRINFTLNEWDYIDIQPIDKTHELYGSMPLFNAWASYFILTFEQNDKGDYLQTLTFEHQAFEPCVLNFEESY